jgi:hypothetical protein
MLPMRPSMRKSERLPMCDAISDGRTAAAPILVNGRVRLFVGREPLHDRLLGSEF